MNLLDWHTYFHPQVWFGYCWGVVCGIYLCNRAWGR